MRRLELDSQGGFVARGRTFSAADLDVIKSVVSSHASSTRTRISQEVCVQLDWRQPNGWLKERACRDVLCSLEDAGVFTLPARRVVPNNGARRLRVSSSLTSSASPEVITRLDLKSVELRLAKRGAAEDEWNRVVAEYHYLGFDVFVGRSMKYFVQCGGVLVGAIGWCDPSWAVDSRDRMLLSHGFCDREAIRSHGVNNGRFLILPWIQVPNLASKILSSAAKAVARDWADYYAVRPEFLETYVDDSKFTGACYRAANWVHLGTTRGFKKSGRVHSNSQTHKSVYLYPLSRRLRLHIAKEMVKDENTQPSGAR